MAEINGAIVLVPCKKGSTVAQTKSKQAILAAQETRRRCRDIQEMGCRPEQAAFYHLRTQPSKTGRHRSCIKTGRPWRWAKWLSGACRARAWSRRTWPWKSMKSHKSSQTVKVDGPLRITRLWAKLKAIGLKLQGKDIGKPIEQGPKAIWAQSLEASGSGWALLDPGPPALSWVSSHSQTEHRPVCPLNPHLLSKQNLAKWKKLAFNEFRMKTHYIYLPFCRLTMIPELSFLKSHEEMEVEITILDLSNLTQS